MKYRVKGTEICRTSDRVYTHAVIVKGQTKGDAHAFCGSLALAQKALNFNRSMYARREIAKELEIVEVETI